jgi:hypothetical protein
LQSTEFLKLIDPEFTRPDLKFTRGAKTIARVVERIGRDFKWAVAATRIFQAKVTAAKVPVEVWALSPSHHENLLAKQAIGSLIPNQTTPQRRIPDRNPNHASVALVVIIGNDQVILGADLEETGDARLGWSAVLADPNRPAIVEAEVFKVPHHASETGHHPDVWTAFLCDAPHAVVTPWTLGGEVLPTSNDVARIFALTKTAYISKERLLRSHMRRPNMVEKLVPRSLRSITKKPGQVRLRKRIGAPQGTWQVTLFDGANTLDQFNAA